MAPKILGLFENCCVEIWMSLSPWESRKRKMHEHAYRCSHRPPNEFGGHQLDAWHFLERGGLRTAPGLLSFLKKVVAPFSVIFLRPGIKERRMHENAYRCSHRPRIEIRGISVMLWRFFERFGVRTA